MINIDDTLLDVLSEDQMFLCLQIARYMRASKMVSWPSLKTLSAKCKWDERKVKSVRSSLIDCGFIEAKIISGKPTQYRFLRNGISVFHPVKSKDFTPEQDNETEKEGTQNEGGANAGGTENEGAFSAKEGGQKMPPELVNKELVSYISSFLENAPENQKTDFPEWRKIEVAAVKKVTEKFWQINPFTKERIFEVETPTEFLEAMETGLKDQIFCDRIYRETGLKDVSAIYPHFTNFFEDWASQDRLMPYQTTKKFRQHLINYCSQRAKRANGTFTSITNGQFRSNTTQAKGSKILSIPNDISRYSQPQNF